VGGWLEAMVKVCTRPDETGGALHFSTQAILLALKQKPDGK
jgi:hypothetical protein